jgi:hypothetical protein
MAETPILQALFEDTETCSKMGTQSLDQTTQGWRRHRALFVIVPNGLRRRAEAVLRFGRATD